MKFYQKKFFKFAIIAFALAISALIYMIISGVGSPAYFYARAIDNDYSVFLPNKSEEYYALNSPIHAYSDGEITAITLNDKKLIISHNGDTPISKAFAENFGGQIARFGNYLIYRQNQTMYGIQIDNTDNYPELKYINTFGNPDTLKCNSHFYFDNGETKLFAASVENKLRVYDVDTDDDGKPVFIPIQGLIDYPVTINDNSPVTLNVSSVFYINTDGRLCRRKVDALLQSPDEYLTSVIPTSSMIADEEFVYYISGTKLYKLDITDTNATPQELSFKNSNFALGKVDTPKGLSFKGSNLLITDFSANGSVQEFAINGTTLEFTGYAIASGLSAYNRVAFTATDIDRYGHYVAALDDYKLTVIDTENCAGYAKAGYKNKFVSDAPSKFALGNGTILYSRGNIVKLTNLKTDSETDVETGISTTALDISYQSGVYYIAYTDGTKTTAVKIDEKTGNHIGNIEFNSTAAKIVAADVFGNVYVADNAYVYKYDRSTETVNSFALAGAKKLATDLAGNLFALASDGKIHKFNAAAGNFELTFDVTGTLGTVKTFGMDFDSGEIYFLVDGKEEIYYTTEAHNYSLKDATPTADFNSATESKTALKVYSAEGDANVYSVTKDGSAFKFNGLLSTENKASEYPLMAKLTISGDLVLYALASEKGVVLVNEKELTEKNAETVSAPEKAYLTTSVYAYALPVVEENGTFAIDNGEGKIRLNKSEALTVERAFKMLGKTFYETTAKVNGEDLACYIPADFTATVLSEKSETETYTVEKVKKTALYKNADLTEELFALEENETIKVLSKENGILKVAAKRSCEWVVGYIAENSLVANPNTIVRNVLIILAVFGSLAGTVSYFLLRKKR